ncbi:thioesterase family protein [Salinarimonas rosea]|uniref:thioesterase family protein n=1 Tax=Salinarimonas rosea TaxID=552063 RepID=UPI000417799F
MAEHVPTPIFFFAPFVSSTMRVEDTWIDYNGHMNLAYYHVLFDRALDEAFGMVGLGPDYVAERRASYFAAEAHVLYRRELVADDPVRVTLQLLDSDEKRFHVYLEVRHAREGWTAATCEILSLHVDMTTKRVTPFPDAVRDNLEVMRAAHARLPRPDVVGRTIGIPSAEPERVTGTRH